MNAARTYLREIIGLGIDPAGLARAMRVIDEPKAPRVLARGENLMTSSVK